MGTSGHSEYVLKSSLAQLAKETRFSKGFLHTDCLPMGAIKVQTHLWFPLVTHFELGSQLKDWLHSKE